MGLFSALNSLASKDKTQKLQSLLAELVDGVIRSAVERQLFPTLAGGFLYTVLVSNPASWLWTPYGMLLGTALGLIFDEEAEEDFEDSEMDRIDHAAMAVAMALLLHMSIYAGA